MITRLLNGAQNRNTICLVLNILQSRDVKLVTLFFRQLKSVPIRHSF